MMNHEIKMMIKTKKEIIDQRCICCFQEFFSDYETFPGDLFDAINKCFSVEIPSTNDLHNYSICCICTTRLIDSQQFKSLILESVAKLEHVKLKENIPLSVYEKPPTHHIYNDHDYCKPNPVHQLGDDEFCDVLFEDETIIKTEPLETDYDPQSVYDTGLIKNEPERVNEDIDIIDYSPLLAFREKIEMSNYDLLVNVKPNIEEAPVSCIKTEDSNADVPEISTEITTIVTSPDHPVLLRLRKKKKESSKLIKDKNVYTKLFSQNIHVNLFRIEHLNGDVTRGKSSVVLRPEDLISLAYREIKCLRSVLRPDVKFCKNGEIPFFFKSFQDASADSETSRPNRGSPTRKRSGKAKSDEVFACDLCYKSYTLKWKLIKHVRNHCNIKCDVCSKGFYVKSLLSKHMRSHSDTKEFNCTKCHRSFKYKYNLKVHERNIHQKYSPAKIPKRNNTDPGIDPEQEYQCKICVRNFVGKANMIAHLEQEHGLLKGSRVVKSLPKVPYNDEVPTPQPPTNQSNGTKGSRVVKSLPKVPYNNEVPTPQPPTNQSNGANGEIRHFKCNVCKKRFFKVRTLKCHMQIHHGASTKGPKYKNPTHS